MIDFNTHSIRDSKMSGEEISDELFEYLASMKSQDRRYERVLSSMCTIPHPIAVRAHQMFIETNLGDPGLFSGTAKLESLLIKKLGSLLHNKDAFGYCTAGGTESNIQALRIARDIGVKKIKDPKKPNVVIPESAHFSFNKAGSILSLEVRAVPSDKNEQMSEDLIEDYIDENTVALVGVAGTTEYGVVDPIKALSEIAIERDIFLHVDAAFGGFVLPFLSNAPAFDFKLDGVSTLALDPHKMGMSTIPGGCLLARDPSFFKPVEVDTPYLTVHKEYTLNGTRPGCAVAAAFAVLEYLGINGFKEMVDDCMKNNGMLIDGMKALGYPVAAKPVVNVASFVCPNTPDGWYVSRTRKGHMRTVAMPHITKDIIQEFLKAVKEM